MGALYGQSPRTLSAEALQAETVGVEGLLGCSGRAAGGWLGVFSDVNAGMTLLGFTLLGFTLLGFLGSCS
jgi:hypothetical protein